MARAHLEPLDRLPAEKEAIWQNDRLAGLAEAIGELSAAGDLVSIAAIACNAARSLADADGSAFMRMEAGRCECVFESGAEPVWKGRHMTLSACPAGEAWVTGHALTCEDVRQDPSMEPEVYRGTSVRGLAVAPMLVDVEAVGALGLYWKQPHAATNDELRLLQLLASSTSVAIQRVRMVNELSDSEERYRELVESLEDVVISIDNDGRITYASPSVSKYGYSPAEAVGESFLRFVHPEDAPYLVESLAMALTGKLQTRVFRLLSKDGSERYVRTAGRPVMRDGKITGINGVMIDVTELRRTEQQLQMAQKMDAIGRLAGGIAHDFNNLLSVILSYAGFVAEEVRDLEGVCADVEEIRKAGTRAATLTRQLLAFSRAQVLEPQALDLNRLATDLERMLRRVVDEDIELVQRLTPDLGTVKGDPGQIEQVIMNLVVNARDVMPGGGRITVATRNIDETPSDHDEALPPGRWVELAISDTGTGMDAKTKERLFEPFFTTKEVGKGTGLGLSIVYGIVTQSGGHIRVDSELGRGTTFAILLPRVDVPAQPVRIRPVSLRPPVGTETVLLVEDDEAVRALAARILREAGYNTLVAGTCTEALSLCTTGGNRIALLLTDMVMPQLNGPQLAERLLLRQPGLRVLYMSGYSRPAIENHGELEPSAHFIAKPFSASELRRKVRDVLDDEATHRIQFLKGEWA